MCIRDSATAIDELLASPGTLADEARARAAEYTWERAAAATLQAYRDAAA